MKFFISIFIFLALSKSYCQGLQVGQRIENATFNSIINNPKSLNSLEQFLDKPLILEFWATWCGPCIQTMPHLEKIYEENKSRVNVLTVSDEPETTLLNFIGQSNFSLPVAIDEASIFSNSMGIQSLPTTLIISKSGEILAITTPDRISQKIIDELDQGQELSILKSLRGFDKSLYAKESISSGIQSQTIFTNYRSDLPAFIFLETEGEYANRRIIISNFTIYKMYQNLFGYTDWQTKSNLTFQEKYNPELTENLFYLDIIVPPGSENELKDVATLAISQNSSLKANVLSEFGNVKSIVVENPSLLPPVATGNEVLSQTGTMSEMAQMFTAYNVFGQTITDNTGLGETRFIMDLNKFPTDPDKLAIIFSRIGISLRDNTDNSSFLYLYE